jgi:hypothetical protein
MLLSVSNTKFATCVHVLQPDCYPAGADLDRASMPSCLALLAQPLCWCQGAQQQDCYTPQEELHWATLPAPDMLPFMCASAAAQ